MIVVEMALYRHKMERKLKESERWLTAILRSIGDSVVATDGEWRIRFMNPRAESLTGWAADVAIGRELAEVVRFSLTANPRPRMPGPESTGGGTAEGILTARDGSEIAVEEKQHYHPRRAWPRPRDRDRYPGKARVVRFVEGSPRSRRPPLTCPGVVSIDRASRDLFPAPRRQLYDCHSTS